MTAAHSSTPPRPSKHPTGGADLVTQRSGPTRRLAAAILEVLAGARTPTQAAQALQLTVPRYYQLEAQALRGLLDACEPKPRGRVRSVDTELAALRKEIQRLQRELTRQQSLARAAQRTIGLAPPTSTPSTKGKKPRKRRVARALAVAQRLQHEAPAAPAAPTIPLAANASAAT